MSGRGVWEVELGVRIQEGQKYKFMIRNQILVGFVFVFVIFYDNGVGLDLDWEIR